MTQYTVIDRVIKGRKIEVRNVRKARRMRSSDFVAELFVTSLPSLVKEWRRPAAVKMGKDSRFVSMAGTALQGIRDEIYARLINDLIFDR